MSSRRRLSRTPQHRQRPSIRHKNLLAVAAGALAVVIALIVVGIVLQGDENKEVAPPAVTGVGKTLGSADAKVTIEEYADFQCPFCGEFAREVEKAIEEQYIKTGQVRIVYRHFAFLGQESQWAAEASECANEQGRFWDYYAILYSRQSGENRGAFSINNLKGFASELGLDTAAFNSCLDSHKYAQAVQQERSEGQNRGVRSTPTFFVNGRKIEGLVPFTTFQQVIEAELKR